MTKMNNQQFPRIHMATVKYLEYVARNGTSIGVEKALDAATMAHVQHELIAKLTGATIPNWYGDMLGGEGEQTIFDPQHPIHTDGKNAP